MGIIRQAPKVGDAAEVSSAPGRDVEEGPPAIHRDMRKALDDAFGRKSGEISGEIIVDDGVDPQNQPSQSLETGGHISKRVLKIGAALVLIAVFGAWPLRTLLQAASVDAVVNFRLVTIRAPIDGEVVAAPTGFTTWLSVEQAPRLQIVDSNVNRVSFDEQRRALGRLEDERPALVARIDQVRGRLAALEEQGRQFQDGRTRQFEARVAALESDFAGTRARADESRLAEERITVLKQQGVVSVAEAGRITRDRLVAEAAEVAARRRIEEATVELTSARTGSFVGDSYNDRPNSVQRADDLRQRVDDLSADLRRLDAQIARVRTDTADEAARLRALSDVEVALPVSGRIWEIMTARGEQIRRGQDLVRVLDCSAAVVTATVSEAVYNKLHIGGSAKFHPSAGGLEDEGVIVSLTGLSAAPSNFAIEPRNLGSQGYHVTVALSKPAEPDGCAVGRTGRVVFDGSAPDPARQPMAFGLRR